MIIVFISPNIPNGIQKLDFGHCGIDKNVRGTFLSRSRSSEFLAGARDVFVNTARSEDENYEGNPTQPGVPEDRLDLWGKALPGVPEDRLDLWGKALDKSQFLSHERYIAAFIYKYWSIGLP